MKKLLSGFVFVFATCSAALAATVSDVKVKALDGFGGDLGSVVKRCQMKVGAAYDPTTVTRDVKALEQSGEFEYVSAAAQETSAGVELTYTVKRKLRYRAPLAVTGCSYFDSARVAKEAELKDGYLYGAGDLADAAAKVRLAYQKKYYLNARVTPRVTALPGGHGCDITFAVDEGARQKIRSLVYAGAARIDTALLDEAVGQYPWWNPIGWFMDAPVTEEQQFQCFAKIEEVYRNQGFLDVSVTGPERVTVSDGKIDLRFTVVEGPRYTIGRQTVTGLTRYPEAVVREKSLLPETGSVAGLKTLDEAAHRIAVTVGSGDSGLADTRVDVRRVPRADDPQTLDVVYQVTEGVPVVISEVAVRGNDFTKDKVIRREIALGPGDRMLADRAERSKKRLENLNYFSRVSYALEKTGQGVDANGAEHRRLVYTVEEKNTGSFMVGVGASSVDSVFLSAEVSQANFDLFAPRKWFRGAGQKGRAFVQWGPRIQTMEASVTEPYLFDRMLELTVEGYRRGRWYDQYDLYRNGASAALSYPVKFWPTWDPFGRFGLRLSGEYIEFDEVDDDLYVDPVTGVEKPLFKNEEDRYGGASEAVLRVFWNRDTRDNFRTPTRGYRTQIFADLAGGDNEYWRLGFNHRHYFNVWKRYNHVLTTALRVETIDAFNDDVPIYNRLFLGGPRSIRGIEYRHVGPMVRRAGGSDWDPWGGQTLFCANVEYTVPIVKMLRVAVFTDFGSVGPDDFDFDFSDTFAWTVGIGFRLDLPMFPIRLDFATPITEPDHAEKEVFSFTVGYDF
jgi:outer membrane protein insertion porin family